MPTDKEIAAGIAALSKIQNDPRLKNVSWPSDRDQVLAVLEAAERARAIPKATLDAVSGTDSGPDVR